MSFLSEAKLNCDVSFPFDVAGIYFWEFCYISDIPLPVKNGYGLEEL